MCRTLGPSCTSNGDRFGDKAANLGLLANRDMLGRKAQRYSQSQIAGYDITPQGFAIPLSFCNDFPALPESAAVTANVAALIAAERGGKRSPNQRKTLSTEPRRRGPARQFSVKLSSTDNADLSCKREESLDGVVTKIDMKPKTVRCAIKVVYASLWNTRAIEERSFVRIDHATAAMGLAVIPA